MAEVPETQAETCRAPAEVMSKVCASLRQWALEGPPRNPRAAAGSLAELLEEVNMQSTGSVFTEDMTRELTERRVEELEVEVSNLRKEVLELQSQNEALRRQEQQALEEFRASAQQERDEILSVSAAEKRGLEARIEELHAATRESQTMPKSDCDPKAQSKASARTNLLETSKQNIGSVEVDSAKLKRTVSAVCRIRPLGSYQSAEDVELASPGNRPLGIDGQEIIVEDAKGHPRKFKIDKVLDDSCTQEDLFSTAAPWVEHAAVGGSSCVFAYGATGSGKTHSMLGDGSSGFPGLAHYALRQLIEGPDGGQLKLSMLEVYCEQIRDLLAEPGEGSQPILTCSRRDAQGRMALDCVEIVASKVSDAEDLLIRGFAQRATEGTLCNSRSSRSHVVLTMEVIGSKRGRLVLVDLAGSENVQRSGADEDAKLLAEAKAINRSLSALADVVEATAKQQSFVPYRNSRLTMLLEETLSASKVLLLVHVSPFTRDSTDTAHSLQFASRVRATDFSAHRLRQDQEDRAKAAQTRYQQESRQLQTQLETTKKELADVQKTKSELKQQTLRMSEQLREMQRQLVSEQELRSKAESARDHRRGVTAGESSGVAGGAEQSTSTEPRVAPSSRPISPSARAASSARLLPPRCSARSVSTPVLSRNLQQGQPSTASEGGSHWSTRKEATPARQRPAPETTQSGILVDAELAETRPSAVDQQHASCASGLLQLSGKENRPALLDRTNSTDKEQQLLAKDKDLSLVKTLMSSPSPARAAGPEASPKHQNVASAAQVQLLGSGFADATMSTPTRHLGNSSLEQNSAIRRSPEDTGTAFFPSEARLRSPSNYFQQGPGRYLEYDGVQVRSALRKIPTDFHGRMLRRQELGTAGCTGKRVTFAEQEKNMCSPPRWYLDLLEHDQALRQAAKQEASRPRSLTPPMRRRPQEASREVRESRELARWR